MMLTWCHLCHILCHICHICHIYHIHISGEISSKWVCYQAGYLIQYFSMDTLHSQILVPCMFRSVSLDWRTTNIEMAFWQFCINPEILGHYGKFSELYFNEGMSSNCVEKLLISIKFFSTRDRILLLFRTISPPQLEGNGMLKYSSECNIINYTLIIH